MNLGIAKIGTYIPNLRQNIEEVVEYCGGNDREIKLMKRLHNIQQVPIVEEGQRLDETLGYALLDLKLNENIDLILYAHSLLAQVPHDYGLLNKVLKPFNLNNVKNLELLKRLVLLPFMRWILQIYILQRKKMLTMYS